MPRDAPLLRRGLLSWMLLLVLLSLCGGVASYFITARISDDLYDRTLLEIANELSLHLAAGQRPPHLSLSPAAARLLLLDKHDKIAYRISTETGQTIAGDPAIPLPAPRDGRGRNAAFYSGRLHGSPVSVALIRTNVPEGSKSTTILVQVAETDAKRSALVWNILLSIVLPQFLLIVVASLLVWIGVGRELGSLRRLQQAVANRSHLDLSPIAEHGVPGEVRPLLHAFNDLMIRLQEILTFQTRFIADAAHQLRTPVAGLKTHIEVMLRETDATAMKRSLQQVYQSVDRLSRLVSQLLSLARNEPSSTRAPDFVALDLNQMMFNLTAEWVPEAYRKRIDLGFEGPGRPVAMQGDAVRLTELANNLLDNAIRYTRQGGRVTVRVADDGRPALSVSDDGPRIPPEERDHIFERFHRLLGTQVDGSGLGLAIVREIASLHGAQVLLADDSDGIGNRFTVLFPATRPALRRREPRPSPATIAAASGSIATVEARPPYPEL